MVRNLREDPGHTGGTMSLGLHPPWKSWMKWLERGGSGLSCSGCCRISGGEWNGIQLQFELYAIITEITLFYFIFFLICSNLELLVSIPGGDNAQGFFLVTLLVELAAAPAIKVRIIL